VVFSSGFFGFFAHAGFLSGLRALGIEPAGFAGSSSGAILGAMAAANMTDRDIKRLLFDLKKSDFWDPDPLPDIFRSGLRGFRGYAGYLQGEGFGRLLGKLPVRRIEECALPLMIAATNLTLQREEIFTRGDLIRAIRASGAVPMLFKPVEIDGSLFVDGGIVNKAPVLPLCRRIRPERVIVHFIASENLGDRTNPFLRKRMTPWHIQHLAVNVARQTAYEYQCDQARQMGIEIVEVRTRAPGVGPNTLERGPLAYQKAKEETMRILSARLVEKS
jgi:NTE family protein